MGRQSNDSARYTLRGRFVARHSYVVPEELTPAFRDEQAEPAPALPRWYSSAAFTTISTILIFFMCSVGRPGA